MLLTGPLDYETDSAYTVGLRVVDMAGCSGDICQVSLASPDGCVSSEHLQ